MIGRITSGISSRLRAARLAARGVAFEGKARINRIEVATGWKNIHLGDQVALDNGVVLVANGMIHIGAQTYINRYSIIDSHQSVKIGPRCMIGPHTYITDSNHGTAKGTPVALQDISSAPVEIGADVWIGANVSILAGVTIGDGAVIGAGSVVSRDIASNTIAAGVPAKAIRQRS